MKVEVEVEVEAKVEVEVEVEELHTDYNHIFDLKIQYNLAVELQCLLLGESEQL